MNAAAPVPAWRVALGESFMAAGVALLLALPLAGVRLPSGAAQPLAFRPWWVVLAVIDRYIGEGGIERANTLDLGTDARQFGVVIIDARLLGAVHHGERGIVEPGDERRQRRAQ